jgi:hypothetical protein
MNEELVHANNITSLNAINSRNSPADKLLKVSSTARQCIPLKEIRHEQTGIFNSCIKHKKNI